LDAYRYLIKRIPIAVKAGMVTAFNLNEENQTTTNHSA
jgi:hypothetical protein